MEPLLTMRPPLGTLGFHDLDGLLGAQERAGEVHIHHRRPLLEGEVLHGHRRGTHAGVVEQEVEAPAERLSHLGEQALHIVGPAHVSGDGHHLPAAGLGHRHGLVELLLAPAGDRHVPAVALQRQRRRLPDARAAARDERHLALSHSCSPPG